MTNIYRHALPFTNQKTKKIKTDSPFKQAGWVLLGIFMTGGVWVFLRMGAVVFGAGVVREGMLLLEMKI